MEAGPREPPRGLLRRWVAGTSLRGVDAGHDRVDVVAAAGPGGLSAAGTAGGTAHVVLLVVDSVIQTIPPWGLGVASWRLSMSVPGELAVSVRRPCLEPV